MAISETARIAPQARLGRDVSVGDFTLVGPLVVIGDGSVIESHCVLGHETPLTDGPLVIGERAHIRSHSILYAGSRFGAGLRTGHRVTVREGTDAGVELALGTLCDVQGDTRIGDHVRTQSNVFIAKQSTIGSFVWLFPHVVLTNDRQPPSEGPLVGPTICDYAIIAAMSTILSGVRVGEHALVAAHSFVRDDVPAGMVVAGVPATGHGPAAGLMLADDPQTPAYPWPRRFRRDYPPEVVAAWEERWPTGGAV